MNEKLEEILNKLGFSLPSGILEALKEWKIMIGTYNFTDPKSKAIMITNPSNLRHELLHFAEVISEIRNYIDKDPVLKAYSEVVAELAFKDRDPLKVLLEYKTLAAAFYVSALVPIFLAFYLGNPLVLSGLIFILYFWKDIKSDFMILAGKLDHEIKKMRAMPVYSELDKSNLPSFLIEALRDLNLEYIHPRFVYWVYIVLRRTCKNNWKNYFVDRVKRLYKV